MNVEIRKLPEFKIAYVRRTGAYGPEIGECFGKLLDWACKNGVCGPQSLILAAYHDCPEATPPEKCRSDACITLPEGVVPEAGSGIEVQTLPAGEFAIYLCKTEKTEDYKRHWEDLCCIWLPESGYSFVNQPCYEIYYNCGDSHPLKQTVIDICIPVKKS